MRVDIVSKEYPPAVYGGAGVHVEELVRALRARGDVDVQAGGRFVASQASLTGTGSISLGDYSILELTHATGWTGTRWSSRRCSAAPVPGSRRTRLALPTPDAGSRDSASNPRDVTTITLQ